MHTGDLLPLNKENHDHRYVQYAAGILSGYSGREPFHLYLKDYFSTHKKHGARDRKQITSLCYRYFRLGAGAGPSLSVEEKISLANFLMGNITPGSATAQDLEFPLELALRFEKMKDIFSPEKIFPFPEELSAEIDPYKFFLSFLTQPKLFIRLRPGSGETVLRKLQAAGIPFERVNENCLALSGNEKVSQVLVIDRDAVIQDYNSQRTGAFMSALSPAGMLPLRVWDCCAASGGKSILACDILKNIQLTVSDTRKNILENLKERFRKAGIIRYRSLAADLSDTGPVKGFSEEERFDFVIADVPCSGSGTWSRTPEQLHFFSRKNIQAYADLQKKIISTVTDYLSDSGYLLYITCSVFRKENEENVDFIQKKLKCTLVDQQYLKGYEMRADTLFAALFKKGTTLKSNDPGTSRPGV
jgi:16S rRNA (cytosine967-C5)-methyltransferase